MRKIMNLLLWMGMFCFQGAKHSTNEYLHYTHSHTHCSNLKKKTGKKYPLRTKSINLPSHSVLGTFLTKNDQSKTKQQSTEGVSQCTGRRIPVAEFSISIFAVGMFADFIQDSTHSPRQVPNRFLLVHR